MRRAALQLLLLGSVSALASTTARGDEPSVDLAERVPASWLDGSMDERRLPSPRWLRRLPPHCHTLGGYREHCQGVRDVPTPSGSAAALAARLGLGVRATALHLRRFEAFDEWQALVEGVDPQRRLEWPVPEGNLGREFGFTRQAALADRRHPGIDIGAPEGTAIVAARGGLVVYSDDGLTGFGNAVMILHDGDRTTFYGHCLRTLVFAGQRVERGQPIAEVGQTGFAYMPHLHFEYRWRGAPTDPLPHMRDRRRRETIDEIRGRRGTP